MNPADVDTPHFQIPFRVDGASAAVVEQGSDDDVVQNCATILRTPYGYREDEPDFGLTPQLFKQITASGMAVPDIEAALLRDEPRASFLTAEQLEGLSTVIDSVLVKSVEGDRG